MNNTDLFQQRLSMITAWQPENQRESKVMNTLLTTCLNNKLGIKKEENAHLHVHCHRNAHY
ncbi:hypothetical protein L0B53_18375 (plasmid) [Vibrio sp. SS-MA-C1-2]|uniref:hypothetical protein n=1 Tax=Vibrio sp. SS-MA-C1-2 TaxID=2908646 RepID=UPI001F37B834|nr:hypothetical protein [Vibrio sp. SS-MA-C1-2]UJF20299.1 hypothetical protein L0B53_18375 [Vibrio sp. SS-MA-C1-2]